MSGCRKRRAHRNDRQTEQEFRFHNDGFDGRPKAGFEERPLINPKQRLFASMGHCKRLPPD